MLKTVEMILQEKPPCSPPLTIMNSTVTAVELFRFLGITIYQDLKWENHIKSIVKKAQQRLCFLRPAEDVQPAKGADETVHLCNH